MPLLTDDSVTQQAHTITKPVTIVDLATKTPLVDTRYDPMGSLLLYVEGSVWTVDYYAQVLGIDSELAPQAISSLTTNQQYRRYRGMEMRVTSPLNQSQSGDDKTVVLQGTANLYPFMIPNEGDMFVADAGDGRLVVFQVKSTSRKSVYKDTVYEIEYESADYADGLRLADLEAKTIQTLHYSKDFLAGGQNPLLVTDDYNAVEQLTQFQHHSRLEYLRRFGSDEYKVILIPDQDDPIYDHFMAAFIHEITDVSKYPRYMAMRVLNCDDSVRMKQPSILDAMLEQDPKMLGYMTQRVGLAYSRSFTRGYVYGGVAHSGVRQVVFPKTVVSASHHSRELGELNDLTPVDATPFVCGEVTITDLNNQAVVIPYIKPIWGDDYYLFSQAFYQQDLPNCSLLEKLTWSYLQNTSIPYDELAALIDDSANWRNLEKFYFLPVLWVLSLYYVRTL